MNEKIELKPYCPENDRDAALKLIKGFWLSHNNYEQTDEEAAEDLSVWSGEKHKMYLIANNGKYVGFVHLGSRGNKTDWLEDLFVLPEHRGQGIGSHAIRLAEKIVGQYSDSLYIEAAARNERAIRLYRRLGYDCLNTITVRKDISYSDYKVVRTEKIYDQEFEIRKDVSMD